MGFLHVPYAFTTPPTSCLSSLLYYPRSLNINNLHRLRSVLDNPLILIWTSQCLTQANKRIMGNPSSPTRVRDAMDLRSSLPGIQSLLGSWAWRMYLNLRWMPPTRDRHVLRTAIYCYDNHHLVSAKFQPAILKLDGNH